MRKILMKKIFLALILGLLWCNVGVAGIKEPGQEQKCGEFIEKKKFFPKKVLKIVDKENTIVVFYIHLTYPA